MMPVSRFNWQEVFLFGPVVAAVVCAGVFADSLTA
jgi:hypothetical protein